MFKSKLVFNIQTSPTSQIFETIYKSSSSFATLICRAAGTWGSWVSGPPPCYDQGGSGYLWTPLVLAPNYKNNLILFNNLFKLIQNYKKTNRDNIPAFMMTGYSNWKKAL